MTNKLIKVVDIQKTKIIATLGPASSSKERLLDLVKAGVDVFRLNFSHGKHKDHQAVIERIVEINKTYKQHIGILGDLQGPKLRVGEIKDNRLEIKPGDMLTFTSKKCVGTMKQIYMSYEQFPQDVQVGEKVLIDDGKLELKVHATDGSSQVKLEVMYGGILSSNKGVNLPDTKISQPSLTEKDLEDLEFMLTQPINWIALSFVRKGKDITDLQRKIADAGHSAKVIAKIEKPEAITNIKSIIKATDAIMIARGDLGVEVAMEKLPSIQKMIIKRCIQKGKPVIVATQMMESMITSPSPTRAEITDVANAVLDGTDAVMLSGETSVGAHPVKVVEAMNKIIFETEKSYEIHGKRPKASEDSPTYLSDKICLTASKLAEEIDAKGLIGITVSGYTAFKMSSYRPSCPIFIFSPKEEMLATLNLLWGVKCFHYDKFSTTDETVKDLAQILKEKKKVKEGDIVVNTAAMPLHKRFRTNMLKISVVD